MKEVEFKREKISYSEKITSEIISNYKLQLGRCENDFINDLMTARLIGYIYSNVVDERDLTYYCERPTFLDWLLRKKKQVIFKLKAKDLLLNPPKVEGQTIRMYELEQKRN